MKGRDETLFSRMMLMGWLILCVVGSFAIGSFSVPLVEVWINNSLPLFLLALAAALVISCGQIDISTGGVMSLSGMIVVFIFGIGSGGLIGATLAHVAALGAVCLIYWTYSMVAIRGLSTLIVTLSALLLAKGLATLLQTCIQGVGELCRVADGVGAQSAILPDSYVIDFLGTTWFSILTFAGLFGAMWIWRYKSRWGLNHIAVGMDKEAAHFCRISITRVYRHAFLAAGLLVFLATVIRLHGQGNGGWSANTGWGDELLAIAIAVIGGTRVSGGRIDPLGLVITTLAFYASRDIITNALGLPSEVASIFFGLMLFAIAWIDLRTRHDRD